MTQVAEENEARIMVMSIALQEVCRALNPAQAAQVAAAMKARVSQMPALQAAADVAAAGELAGILQALCAPR